MPNLHFCTVSIAIREGITHSVEVAAETLYEAAVLGANALKLSDGAATVPVRRRNSRSKRLCREFAVRLVKGESTATTATKGRMGSRCKILAIPARLKAGAIEGTRRVVLRSGVAEVALTGLPH